MLTVTKNAKERIKEALKHTSHPETAFRIVPSPSEPNQLQLVFDKEKEGDQVVATEDGKKLLFIGPDLAPVLDEMIVDYQETPEGEALTISKPGPNA
jgi:Fe-S cluster assembly iron-binding protein IscA